MGITITELADEHAYEAEVSRASGLDRLPPTGSSLVGWPCTWLRLNGGCIMRVQVEKQRRRLKMFPTRAGNRDGRNSLKGRMHWARKLCQKRLREWFQGR